MVKGLDPGRTINHQWLLLVAGNILNNCIILIVAVPTTQRRSNMVRQHEGQLPENVLIPDQSVTRDVNAPSVTRSSLSDEQVQQVLALIKDADSVELKLSVPQSHLRSAITALGMDPLQAQIRQVYFFDTPDLALNKQGIVVRARRVQGKGDDSVIKLRPVVPSELPPKLHKSPNLVVEVDAMPGGFVCSASLKGTLGTTGVRDVIVGKQSLRKLFSREQREFYAAYAPEGIELETLAILGPIFVLKLRFSPKGYDRSLVAELWLYPDDSHTIELSTKCKPAEAFQVAAETRAFLSSRGVSLSGEQQTKTRNVLNYFSKHLSEGKV